MVQPLFLQEMKPQRRDVFYGKFTASVNRYFVDNGATEWWLTGLKTTLLVTVIALCIGVVLGLLIALIRSTHEQTGKLNF